MVWDIKVVPMDIKLVPLGHKVCPARGPCRRAGDEVQPRREFIPKHVPEAERLATGADGLSGDMKVVLIDANLVPPGHEVCHARAAAHGGLGRRRARRGSSG